MNSEKNKVYIVVGIPFDYIESIKRSNERGEKDEKRKLIDQMDKGELISFIERIQFGAVRNMGYFLSLEEAKNSIKSHPYHDSLSENGYYEYLLIEEVQMGIIDIYTDELPLAWYNIQEKTTGNNTYLEYIECEMPDWAEGTISWS